MAYHGFADTRSWLGIPNAGDVLSNIGFLLVGVYGAFVLIRGVATVARWESWGLWILFIGFGLVSAGSAYYHWAPDSDRLVWDRLPMTVAFTSLFALTIGERLSLRVGGLLLVPLLATGIASVLWWVHTDDLRFYGLVQFYPLCAIPLMLWLCPPTYTRGVDLIIAVGWYGVAKVFELTDAWCFSLGGLMSGHTLKHLAAALACFLIVRMVALRRPTEGLRQSSHEQ